MKLAAAAKKGARNKAQISQRKLGLIDFPANWKITGPYVSATKVPSKKPSNAPARPITTDLPRNRAATSF